VWQWLKNSEARSISRFLLPFRHLLGPRLDHLRIGYEKCGLSIYDEPVAWNAEAVLVEASLRAPFETEWRKSAFQLHLPGRPPLLPAGLELTRDPDTIRVLFRLPPLTGETEIELYWHGSRLGHARVPFVSPESFFAGLCLRSAAVFASLGKCTVQCRALLEEQCHGWSASGILSSSTSLLPLADHPITAEFTDSSSGYAHGMPIRLTPSQLQARETLIAAFPPWQQDHLGRCAIRWMLRDRLLARVEMRLVDLPRLLQSLYLIDARYLFQESRGTFAVSRHLPAEVGSSRLRPCFLVASREPGVAAICPFEVRIHFREPELGPRTFCQDVLVTDGPSVCLPPGMSAEDFKEVRAFELLCLGRSLGILSASPTPAASFTDEGGFRPPANYSWTPVAEEELLERLQRLMNEEPEPAQPHSAA
jgi:hypothetical protein